eukprot:CAMPEP_0117652240 /NCGR_PEP_ID=MMETSP0804-20121206/2521_1 /TAXON_ID=1074897 /ORGANISM="Tetraselmis astigmatica, Strain CCMP880" /LENGTH=361 /DNA_ID=CAMNT_0005458273 /DNA_START=92 /DNA_END=1177 /DNA_ORIENTATION=+
MSAVWQGTRVFTDAEPAASAALPPTKAEHLPGFIHVHPLINGWLSHSSWIRFRGVTPALPSPRPQLEDRADGCVAEASPELRAPGKPPSRLVSLSGEVYLGREWGRWPLRAWGESQEDNGVRSIYFAGGGIYFFWQLGVAKYLGQRFDLSRTPMSGTSCGALCATLAACGVDPERALQTAYQLSLEADLWDRPLGLAGIWGRLILEWMEELLPEEAAEMCRDRVEIMVTELPSLQQTPVADFKNKDDLIAVNMASIHVPIFLDWRFTRECRGKQCVDGSLPDVVFRRASPTGSGSVDNEDTNQIVISHVMDDSLRLEEFGFLKLREYEEVVHMMDLGYRFAQDLEASGAFIGLPAMSSSAE